MWTDSNKFIAVEDLAYALNRNRVDSWLQDKSLLTQRVYALRRVGPFALAFRYASPLRVSRFDSTRAARTIPRLVWGWPL